MTEVRSCRGCGEDFTAITGRRGRPQRFCTPACKARFFSAAQYARIKAARRPKLPKPEPPPICSFCTKPIPSGNHAQTYCSSFCKGRDKARQRERLCVRCNLPWTPNWRPLSQAATECWMCRSEDFIPGGRHRSAIKEYRRKQLIEREERHCQDCGGQYSEDRLEAHHIVSPSMGGTHELKNLKLLCVDCHRGSGWARNHAALIEAGLAIPPAGTQLDLVA